MRPYRRGGSRMAPASPRRCDERVSLPWVKLYVSLLDNDIYKRLSMAARFSFVTALMLAQKCELDGALALRVGPLSVAEVCEYTKLPKAQQKAALEELIAVDLLSLREDGAYVVQRFKEFQEKGSADRVRAFRERKQVVPVAPQPPVPETPPVTEPTVTCNVTETLPERYRNALDKDIDKERDVTPSLRDSVTADEPPEQPVRARPKRPSEPSLEDVATWAIRDTMASVVAKELVGMTPTQWRQRNGKVARELAQAGVSPETVVGWYRQHGFVMLDQLRRAANNPARRDDRRPSELKTLTGHHE